ncbi:Tetraspanin family protein [Brugia pahangi]
MGGGGVCQTFINGILTIVTFLYLAIGLTVIGLTLWLRLDPTFEEMIRKNILRINNENEEMNEVKEQIRLGLTISFWVICGCGIAASVIGFVGVCGAMFANRTTLILNLVTSVMLIAIELAIALFIFLYKPTIEETVTRYVNLADELNGSLDDMKTITSRYKCCSARDDSLSRCVIVNQLTCTTAVWNHLEYNLILAGYFTAGIIIQQTLTTLLCITKIASSI